MTISRAIQGQVTGGVSNFNAVINILLGTTTDVSLNSIQWIGTQTVSGASSVTFSSIPAFNFYLVMWTAQDSDTSHDLLNFQFNADTSAHYYYSYVLNANAANSNGMSAAVTSGLAGFVCGTQSAANFSQGIMLIGGTSQSSLFPSTIGTSSEYGSATDMQGGFFTNLYIQTVSLVYSMKMFSATGDNFTAGTRFSMYGMN